MTILTCGPIVRRLAVLSSQRNGRSRVIVSEHVECCKALKTMDTCPKVITIPVPDPLDSKPRTNDGINEGIVFDRDQEEWWWRSLYSEGYDILVSKPHTVWVLQSYSLLHAYYASPSSKQSSPENLFSAKKESHDVLLIRRTFDFNQVVSACVSVD
jgi:hypothetical protein